LFTARHQQHLKKKKKPIPCQNLNRDARLTMRTLTTLLGLAAGAHAHMSLLSPGPPRNAIDRFNATWKK